MKITINGEKKDLAEPMTVASLLQLLGINPKSVAVERNLKIIGRSDIGMEPVQEGDAIEIIRLVGGG